VVLLVDVLLQLVICGMVLANVFMAKEVGFQKLWLFISMLRNKQIF